MADGPYSLDKLRSTLIRLEDTIIFGNICFKCCLANSCRLTIKKKFFFLQPQKLLLKEHNSL